MEVVIWNTQNAQIQIFKILSKVGKFESIKMILEIIQGDVWCWLKTNDGF